MRKIMLVIMLILVSVCITAGNIIIEEDSMEIGTVSAQNHVFPTEDAYLSYGLVGYWSGDDNALDYSGKGNDGTLSGATYTDGGFGKAFDFDGNDDYVSTSHSDSINFSDNSFSIGFWLEVPFSGASYGGVITKGMTTSAPKNTWGILRDGSSTTKLNYLEGNDAGGAFVCNIDSGDMSNGTRHVVLRRNSTGCAFFIDGIQTKSAVVAPANLTASNNLLMGKSNIYFNGSIDDVKIWNRSLSYGEIRRIYGDYWQPGGTSETRDYYTTGTVTVGALVDLTPAWDKTPADALLELMTVESETDVSGKAVIDHSSLPEFTKAKILKGYKEVNCKEICNDDNVCMTKCDTEYTYEEGRDIGATVTMLVEAVKALNDRVDSLENELCSYNKGYNWC